MTPFLTLRVCDYPPQGVEVSRTREAVLTVWAPDETVLAQLQEGNRTKVILAIFENNPVRSLRIFWQIYNLTAKENAHDKRCSLYLKAQRNTRYINLPAEAERLTQTLFIPRKISQCKSLTGKTRDEEVDLVVIVIGK